VPVLQTLLARLDEREFPTPAPMTEFLLRQGRGARARLRPAQLARAGRAADRRANATNKVIADELGSPSTVSTSRGRPAHAPELRKPDRGASKALRRGVLSAEPALPVEHVHKPSGRTWRTTLPKLETRTNSPMTDTQDLRAAKRAAT